MAPLTITDQQKRDYQEKGYFVLPAVIPPEHVQLLRDAAAHYLTAIHAEMDCQGKDVIGINHRNSRYFISNRWKEVPAMGRFLFGDMMAAICRATLGDNVWLFHEQYVLKGPEKGMPFSWHQDSGYVGHDHKPYLSCWCALDDMSEANGTVYMLPYAKAGTRTWVRHTKQAGSNDMVGYFGKEPGEPVICPAGSIAVFSSTCFHRSGTNTTPNMRRVYLAQYSPEIITHENSDKIWALADPFLKDGKPIDFALAKRG